MDLCNIHLNPETGFTPVFFVRYAYWRFI